jgi:hypothetical protein
VGAVAPGGSLHVWKSALKSLRGWKAAKEEKRQGCRIFEVGLTLWHVHARFVYEILLSKFIGVMKQNERQKFHFWGGSFFLVTPKKRYRFSAAHFAVLSSHLPKAYRTVQDPPPLADVML